MFFIIVVEKLLETLQCKCFSHFVNKKNSLFAFVVHIYFKVNLFMTLLGSYNALNNVHVLLNL